MKYVYWFGVCLALSACVNHVPVVRSVPEQELQKFLEFKKAMEQQVKPTEALVYVVHKGFKGEKDPVNFSVYHDIELIGQPALRFKKNEFVQFSVPPGEYKFKASSVCMRKNKSSAPKAGDVITPTHPDYVVFDEIYPGSLAQALKFEAGQIYVFTFQPECWFNRIGNYIQLLSHLVPEGGDNQLYLLSKAVESRQKAKP